jgi:hypothetical protein
MLQSLEYLTFEGVSEGELALDDMLRLGTNHAISSELLAKRFKDLVSKIEREEITGKPCFFFNLSRMPERKCEESLGRAITRNFLVRSQLFLLSLWLVRDNSGNSGTAFFCVNDDDGDVHYLAERHSAYYFTADSNLVMSTFSRPELGHAIAFLKQLDTVVPKVRRPLDAGRPTGLLHASRLARCLYFAQAARGADDPAVKAVFYSICFESLFSSDTSGVSHRVAERVATFIGTTGQERQQLYKDVHDLYGYRSTVAHGSQLREKEDTKLRPLNVLGDAHLRRCILKILETPELLAMFSKNDPDEVRRYFLEQLFPRT